MWESGLCTKELPEEGWLAPCWESATRVGPQSGSLHWAGAERQGKVEAEDQGSQGPSDAWFPGRARSLHRAGWAPGHWLAKWVVPRGSLLICRQARGVV